MVVATPTRTDHCLRSALGGKRTLVSGQSATAEGDETWQRSQGFLPGLAIAGGTDQVLRNILGERVLGLPPEPRSDKSAPFAGGAR